MSPQAEESALTGDQDPDADTIPLAELLVVAQALGLDDKGQHHFSRAAAFSAWFDDCLNELWACVEELERRPEALLRRLAQAESLAARKDFKRGLAVLEECLILSRASAEVQETRGPETSALTARLAQALWDIILANPIAKVAEARAPSPEPPKPAPAPPRPPEAPAKPLLERNARRVSPRRPKDPFDARVLQARIEAVLSSSSLLARPVRELLEAAIAGPAFQESMNALVSERLEERPSRSEIASLVDSLVSARFKRFRTEEASRAQESQARWTVRAVKLDKRVGRLEQQSSADGGFRSQIEHLQACVEDLKRQIGEFDSSLAALNMSDDRMLGIVKRFVITREAVQESGLGGPAVSETVERVARDTARSSETMQRYSESELRARRASEAVKAPSNRRRESRANIPRRRNSQSFPADPTKPSAPREERGEP